MEPGFDCPKWGGNNRADRIFSDRPLPILPFSSLVAYLPRSRSESITATLLVLDPRYRSLVPASTRPLHLPPSPLFRTSHFFPLSSFHRIDPAMSAIRSTLLRQPLRLRASATAFPAARSLASFTLRPAPEHKSAAALPNQLNSTKSLSSTQPRKIEASAILGDGGMEEAPHTGINVDKPIRMDTCVMLTCQTLSECC